MEKVVLAALMTWLLFCFFPLVFIPYTIICFACMHREEPDRDEERKKEREGERATMYYQICQYYKYASANCALELSLF